MNTGKKLQRPWSPSETSLLRQLYATPGMTIASIGTRLGRPAGHISSKAHALGIRLATPNQPGARSQHIRLMLVEAAAQPRGFAVGDFSGVAAEHVDRNARSLVAKGQLYRATLGHRTVRYFDTAARALAYQSAHKTPAAARSSTTPGRGNRANAAWWPADAEPVITAHTKFTYAPAPAQLLRTNTHSQL